MIQSHGTARIGYRHLAVLLSSLTALGPFSIDTYLPSFLEIGSSLGASQIAVQQTLAIYLTLFAIMTLWHGVLSDALGRRRVILIALALFALASMGCACAKSIETLWLFRAMQGATAGAGLVVGRAMIRDLFSGPDAQRLIAHISIMYAVAPAIGPVIGGQLNVWFGWRSVFVFLTLLASGLWFWCWFKLPDTLDKNRRQPLHPSYLLSSYWTVLTHRRFIAVCFALACNFGGFFIYVTASPVFLLHHLKVKETEFFWLYGPATAGIMFGSWIASRFAGYLTHSQSIQRGFLMLGLAALANLLVTVFLLNRLPWAIIPIFFYTTGMTMSMPSLTLLALNLFPSQRGLASSCQGFIQTSMSSLIASLISPVLCVTSLRLAWGQISFACLGALGFLGFVYLMKQHIHAVEKLSE